MNDTYFQFPLCALAFFPSDGERLEHIICYSFIEAGKVLIDRLTLEEQNRKAHEFKSLQDTPSDYDENLKTHVSAMMGAEVLGVNPGSVKVCLTRWGTLGKLVQGFIADHGPDPTVRLATKLVFEAKRGTGVAYRELAVYAAIVSYIGSKNYPVRITRDTIQCRMLGYKSKTVLAAELSKRTDGAKPLSLRQVNYTLDRLDERQFFARARANERQTYYSIRMTQEDLEKRLIVGKSYSQGFHERRLKRDAALMAKIRGDKPIKVNIPIIADNPIKANGERNGVHSASTTVFTTVSTLVQTPSLQTPATETRAIKARARVSKFSGKPRPGHPEPSLDAMVAYGQGIGIPEDFIRTYHAERTGTDSFWDKPTSPQTQWKTRMARIYKSRMRARQRRSE